MSKLTGTLKQTDLEGGVWVFQAENGQQYHLDGLPDSLMKNGARLEVEGDTDPNAMGIGMMGTTFVVKSARAL